MSDFGEIVAGVNAKLGDLGEMVVGPSRFGSSIQIYSCDCGKIALSQCAIGHHFEGLTLVRCGKFVCKRGGQWCEAHRHRTGTMGYMQDQTIKASFEGFVPESGKGFFEELRTWAQNTFLTKRQKAQVVFDDLLEKHFAPPAPMPTLILIMRDRVFKNAGLRMVEVPREGIIA